MFIVESKTDESIESKSDFKFEIGVEPVVPEFNFRLGPHPHMKDADYPKLLTLCMDMLDKHAGDEYTKKQVFWQYDRALKNLESFANSSVPISKFK